MYAHIYIKCYRTYISVYIYIIYATGLQQIARPGFTVRWRARSTSGVQMYDIYIYYTEYPVAFRPYTGLDDTGAWTRRRACSIQCDVYEGPSRVRQNNVYNIIIYYILFSSSSSSCTRASSYALPEVGLPGFHRNLTDKH